MFIYIYVYTYICIFTVRIYIQIVYIHVCTESHCIYSYVLSAEAADRKCLLWLDRLRKLAVGAHRDTVALPQGLIMVYNG